MTKAALKKEITRAVSKIDDEKFLEAIYTIIQNSTVKSYSIPEEELMILNDRRAKYLSGKSKTFTPEEVKKKLLKKINRK
jgi:Mg2+ and Co2+ transporter CorA